MLRQTPDDDPCSLVTSPAEAVEYAEALLTNSAKPGCDLWAAASVLPLAGMLYAASPRGNNEGIGWLMRATATIPGQAGGDSAQACAARRWGPSWDSAIVYLAQEPRLSSALQSALKLDPRQRDCVVMTIRDALSPWIQTENRGENE
ncbi:hypothetical protein [Mycobacterium riyadhense]|uniref:hypothetical protein n=1 Tax=Mycobacterium riyadhense TaxID=486698 RepID=UPI0019567F23|nr:hypothetical protein [Mycobacterium riyadhense]